MPSRTEPASCPTALLLRPPALHRDLPVGARRSPPTTRAGRRDAAAHARCARASPRWRAGGDLQARAPTLNALLRPAGERARGRRQRARPRRHRARRRPLEHRRAVPPTSPRGCRATCSPTAARRRWSATGTATRPACAARPGSGRRAEGRARRRTARPSACAGGCQRMTRSAWSSTDCGIVMPSRFAVLQVDQQLELGRLLDRQVGRPGALQDPVDIAGAVAALDAVARPVGHQAAVLGIVAARTDRRQAGVRSPSSAISFWFELATGFSVTQTALLRAFTASLNAST